MPRNTSNQFRGEEALRAALQLPKRLHDRLLAWAAFTQLTRTLSLLVEIAHAVEIVRQNITEKRLVLGKARSVAGGTPEQHGILQRINALLRELVVLISQMEQLQSQIPATFYRGGDSLVPAIDVLSDAFYPSYIRFSDALSTLSRLRGELALDSPPPRRVTRGKAGRPRTHALHIASLASKAVDRRTMTRAVAMELTHAQIAGPRQGTREMHAAEAGLLAKELVDAILGPPITSRRPEKDPGAPPHSRST